MEAWNTWPSFCSRHFQMHFFLNETNHCILIIFVSRVGIDNTRQLSISWTIDDQDPRRHMASLGISIFRGNLIRTTFLAISLNLSQNEPCQKGVIPGYPSHRCPRKENLAPAHKDDILDLKALFKDTLFVWERNPRDCAQRLHFAWWRHQMETFSALLAICVGIHRSPVKSPHKGRWRGALMFSFIYAWINGWVNNREADDLIRRRAHYEVIVI